jgi:4-hydroxy-4-methyl-2-oxoglutarate aldolase
LDQKLIVEARRRLYAGVVSDVLDSLGNRNHAMAANLRPLDESLTMFGRARTGLYMPVYHVEPGENPYEHEIRLVDSLMPDDVAVLACPAGNRIGPWGELLSTAAHARKAAGAVTDGLVRDVKLIRAMGFPVFAGGIGPLDSKGRGMVMKIDVPVECGGVVVQCRRLDLRRRRRGCGDPGRAGGAGDHACTGQGRGRAHRSRGTCGR